MRPPFLLFKSDPRFAWIRFQNGSDGTSAAAAADAAAAAAAAGFGGQGGDTGAPAGTSSTGTGGFGSFGGGEGFGGQSATGTSVAFGGGAANTGYGGGATGYGTAATGYGGGTAARGGGAAATTSSGAATGGGAGTASGGSGATGGRGGAGVSAGYAAPSVIDALRSRIANALLGSAYASTYDPNAPNQYMPKPYNPYDPANYGGTPAYGPGVAPFNRGGVTNFGSGQGFGLGPGGQGNVAANQSQTVQQIRAELSNTAQNARSGYGPGSVAVAPPPVRGAVTAQDVYNGLSPDAKAVLQAELAGLSGGMGFPSLYNPAAATASHFGDPNYGPSAPVGPATAATMGAGNVTSAGFGAPSGDPGARGSSAVGTPGAMGPNMANTLAPSPSVSSMMGPRGNAPPAFAPNTSAYAPSTSAFSQALSQNVAENMGISAGSAGVGGGMNRYAGPTTPRYA